MKNLNMVALAMVVLGALNWGFMGVLNLNLVNMLFGSVDLLERLFYVLVGFSGMIVLVNSKVNKK